MSISIELKGVSKKFGEVTAVNNVSFTVNEGELMALGTDRRSRSPAEGLQVYTRYAALYPRSITALAGLAEALEASGDLRQAIQKLGEAAELARAAGDGRADQFTSRRDSLAAGLRENR